MKDIITSREEALLAKIAGRDADLSTFTPPTPANLKEKLMLEIADRLDNGGGSEPELEVVAEIDVGEMTYMSDANIYFAPITFPDVPLNRQLYFNGEDCPLTVESSKGVILYYNLDTETTQPEDPTKPMYAISDDDGGMIASSSNEIANTTIQILAEEDKESDATLPEVSAADNGKILQVVNGEWTASSDFVITVTWSQSEGTDQYSSDKSMSEIVSAIESGRNLIALVPASSQSNDDIRRCPLIHIENTGGANPSIDKVQFSSTWYSSGYIHVLDTCIDYNNSVDRMHVAIEAQ